MDHLALHGARWGDHRSVSPRPADVPHRQRRSSRGDLGREPSATNRGAIPLTGASRPLRILHIIAHVSPERRYGGPNTVAITQSLALARAGHEVTLVAGSEGYPLGTQHIDGVTAQLFRSVPVGPGTFAFRRAPGMRRWLAAHSDEFDIAHVHLSRDLVTPGAARALRIASVIQPHGMLTSPAPGAAKRLIDAIWLRPIFAHAGASISVNEDELRDLRRALPVTRGRLLPNSVLAANSSKPEEPRVPPTVLFLARLHPVKRVDLFVEAAEMLVDSGADLRFIVVGPDEGQGALVRSAVQRLRGRLRYAGSATAAQAADFMARADLYAMPSDSESFGMTMLEALAHGTPVVARRHLPLGEELASLGAARAFNGTARDLADVIRGALEDLPFRRTIARLGPRIVADRWGTAETALKLEAIYREVLE